MTNAKLNKEIYTVTQNNSTVLLIINYRDNSYEIKKIINTNSGATNCNFQFNSNEINMLDTISAIESAIKIATRELDNSKNFQIQSCAGLL